MSDPTFSDIDFRNELACVWATLQYITVYEVHYLMIFRLTLETCKVCKRQDCTGDSVEIIKNACSDDTQLSTFISTPLSTLPDVNTYINTINSDYSYQLAEMTLFQFPNTDKSKFNID